MPDLIQPDAVRRLRTDGFLLLTVSNTARDTINATFDAATEFFCLPQDEKNLNSLPYDSGYRPTGIEYSLSPDRPDQIESFTASRRTTSAAQRLHNVCARLLHARMLTVIDILEPIAQILVMKLAEATSGRAVNPELREALRRWSCLQVNYCRPSEASGTYINEVHEDGHLMTIACATAPGLEVHTTVNGFISLTTLDNEVVVMPGEIASLLSGGQVQPLFHRVRRNPNCRQRQALLLFADIDPRFCIPWINNDVNLNVDIGRRVLTNSGRFGLTGFTCEERSGAE